MLVARYKYDSLSRLVREDNKPLNKTTTWEYDAGGNIQNRFEYEYTIAQDLSNLSPTIIPYSYATSGIRDKLMEYNSEQFEYDGIGNPTIYRNNALTWEKGRQLKSYGSIANYEYNAQGIRTSKTMTIPLKQVEGPNVSGAMTLDYFLDGNKIISQQDVANKIFFIYGVDGIAGFSIQYNNTEEIYYYKKNLQGDIIGLYNSDMILIAKYEYDAWGNHIVKYLDSSGNFVAIESDFCYNDISNINRFIANKNPFRYRSYYYDFETGLYYLNSRYYDPEIGRFINIDDVSIINEGKDLLNGLNLFIYCNSNPVMLTDSNGATWWWEWLLAALAVVTLAVAAVFTAGIVAAALAGAAISGGISLVSQAISGNGLNWGQFALDLGIGAISGALGATSISRIGSMFVGGVLNSGSSIASDAINGQSINWLKAGIALGTGMVSGYLAGAGGKNIKAFSDELGSIKTQNWNKAMSNMIKYQINIANGIYSKSGAIGVMALANYRLNLAFVKDFALFGESAIKQTLLYLGLGNIVNMLISNIFTIF